MIKKKTMNIYELLKNTSEEYQTYCEYYNLSPQVNSDIIKFCEKYNIELDKYLNIISNRPNTFNDGRDIKADRIARIHILFNRANFISVSINAVINLAAYLAGINIDVLTSNVIGFLSGALGVSVADVPSIFSINRKKNEISMRGLFLAYIILTSYKRLEGISKEDRIHYVSRLVKEKIRNNDDPLFERILYSIRHSIKQSLKNYKRTSYKEDLNTNKNIFIENSDIVIDMMFILLGEHYDK